MTTAKPSYVDSQSAFHQAFAADLKELIDGLPIHSNARVLDVPCGTGFYTELLAKRTSNLAKRTSRNYDASCPRSMSAAAMPTNCPTRRVPSMYCGAPRA
jgi:trans-aconitate methyltransferase